MKPELPKLTFTHAGIERTLAKHPRVQQSIRTGTITLDQAAATPWYLRAKLLGKERTFKLAATEKAALAAARDILNGHQANPQQFSQWVAQQEARRGITLGQLATDWFAAGLPFDGEAPRTPAAADLLREILTRALAFWSERRAATVTHRTMAEFVAWRRTHCRKGCEGSRTADLELAALSCLCQWAVLTERIEKNPFAERKRFQQRENITHCHEAMPENDEQLHRLLSWFFGGAIVPASRPDLERIHAGAHLAFTALSGLRPGEPELLHRLAPVHQFPSNLATASPGLIYPMPDGTRRMKVQRLKRGQNPAILIHPTLADFLNVWTAWLDQHVPAGPGAPLFPLAQESVANRLRRACGELDLPEMKPHGFGRAYYVRVRRSQGCDDAAIAVELGQSSNGDLIRSVYGDPLDPVGGNLHDWLPAGAPAWQQLTSAIPEQILKVKF